MTTAPTPESVASTARTAGLDLTPEKGARIATAIGPAFTGFAAISGTLPLDLEPATFQVVQMREVHR